MQCWADGEVFVLCDYTGSQVEPSPAITTPVVPTREGGVPTHTEDTDGEPPALTSVYDEIEDGDEDDDSDAECREGPYDDLQQPTRDFAYQTTPVYQRILSDAAASASYSNVINHPAKVPLYLEVFDDDELPPTPEGVMKTFCHKYHKGPSASADNVTKASTL